MTGAAATTGLAALIVQVALNRQGPEYAVPLETGIVPAPEATERAPRLQRLVSALGSANVALFAGLIAATTALPEEGVIPTRLRTRGG